MSNQQSSTSSRIFILSLGLILFLLYYSIHHSSRDFRLREVNQLKYRNQQSQQETDLQDALFNISTLVAKQFSVQTSSKYFQLMELLPLDQNRRQIDPCATVEKENSLLLINTNTKNIGLKYLNLIKIFDSKSYAQKAMINQEKQCIRFRIYVLKQKRYIFFDSETSLTEYATDISKTLQQVASLTNDKLNIITSEEGSALVMKALQNLHREGTPAPMIIDKLNSIVLINLYNRAIMFDKEPIAAYLDKLKRDILEDRQMLKLFSSLKLIMINTLREQYQLLNNLPSSLHFGGGDLLDPSILDNFHQDSLKSTEQISDNFFVFQKDKHFSFEDTNVMDHLQINSSQSFYSAQFKEAFELSDQRYLALQKSHILHTRQIFNIHAEFNNGDYFTYPPFLELLAKFTTESFNNQLSHKAISYFFKYGETHSKYLFETMPTITGKQCVLYHLHFQCNFLKQKNLEPSLWHSHKTCFRLIVNSTFPEIAHIIYSDEGKFEAYSDSLIKLSEHDKNLQKSVFLMQKINHELLISNPNGHKIIVAVGKLFSPSYPLTDIFSEFQILYMAQIDQKSLYEDQTSRKFPVKTCTNNILIFPDDFPVGKYHRQFLLQNSHSHCYREASSYWKFMENLFDNELLCKNLIIFVLFANFVKRKSITQFKQLTFVTVSMLAWYSELRTYHIVLILFITYLIEKALNFLCIMSSCIQIDRTKVFICMLVMFLVSWVCERFLFQHYDYWKIMLIFLIFFVNEENALVMMVKLYYIQDYILYGEYDWMEIAQFAIFMQATQQGDGKRCRKHFSADQLAKILLVLSLAVGLVFYPESSTFHTLVTCYMKAKIFGACLRKLA